MFIYRSKALICAMALEAVMFINLVTFYISVKIVALSLLLLLSSLLLSIIGIMLYNIKYIRLSLLSGIVFIIFSGIFSIFVIPTMIILFIGYLHQDEKIKLRNKELYE